MGTTLASPVQIYIQGLQDGKLRVLVNNQNYLTYWLVFVALGIVLYALTARTMFASALSNGLKVGFAAAAAQVAGLFAFVVSFYLVFWFSPVRADAWFLEITLLLLWFLFFVFSYATAPESR